jgi:hypothetical protein
MALAKVEEAHQIVKSCSKCAPHFPVPSEGLALVVFILYHYGRWMLLTFHLLDDSIMSMLSLILTLVLFLPLQDQEKQHAMS